MERYSRWDPGWSMIVQVIEILSFMFKLVETHYVNWNIRRVSQAQRINATLE